MRTHEELLEHAGFVRGLARKLAGDTHEDVAQEAWLAALEKPPRHRANVRGWLARVVRNKALMARRAAGRRAVRERSARRTAATVPTDEAVGRLELHELLVRETLALREPYRTALILRYFDGLTPTEIAVRLDVPRRTVETRLRRALAQLRERLDGVCGHAAWAPALLAVAEPARAIWKGAGLVASKLAYAAGGFLLGAAATFTVTETVRPEPPARAPATRRHAELPAPDRERPAAPAPAKADAPPAIRPEHLADHYLRRINDAKNYNETAAVAKEMLTLDAAVSHRVLLEIYERIEPTSRGMRIAQLFAQHPGYPYVTDMLHYCARDGELNLRQWALNLLKQYTLIDFEER
ncbi:MAG: sigma-70 family RNA polymerase sigma factor, partial [Planctomycetota bacterium]|nr:sigma-70 family RNA polymerase sigma factor [Planctomycetota bacterium]